MLSSTSLGELWGRGNAPSVERELHLPGCLAGGACRGGVAAHTVISWHWEGKEGNCGGGAKVKRESKPPASRLGIASELGQVIIDDE